MGGGGLAVARHVFSFFCPHKTCARRNVSSVPVSIVIRLPRAAYVGAPLFYSRIGGGGGGVPFFFFLCCPVNPPLIIKKMVS